MVNNADPEQLASSEANCSGSTLFAKQGISGFSRTRVKLSYEQANLSNYCPFDTSLKEIFCLAFYFKWKCFVLIDYILSETICLSYFCVLFSNIYPKFKFTPNNWSDLWNFLS